MSTRALIRLVLALPIVLAAQRAGADTFAAGSLIIPTDECYQAGSTNLAPWAPSGAVAAVREGWSNDGSQCTWWDANSSSSTNQTPYYGTCWATATSGYGAASTGLQHAFGVLYLLAKNSIPVSVINRTDKLALGDYDFYVAPSDSGNPVYYLRWSGSAYTAKSLASTGGAAVYYRGMPFVISAAYAQQALAVLATSNAANSIFSDVTIHVARADFQAPVLATMSTTPKPIGIVSYANSNGYNIALKYMSDAGLIYAMTGSTSSSAGAGVAYTTISVSKNGNFSYSWSGAPSAACSGGKCTSFTYTPSGGTKTRILDVVWAPDMSQTTCQDVSSNISTSQLVNGSTCFNSTSGLCNTDTCLGLNAFCCPAGNSTPSYSPSFYYSNPDGTQTAYYCPCPQDGTSGSSVQCAIANWQYDAARGTCYSAIGSGNQTGCPSGSDFCDYGTQQCASTCNNSNQCPSGYVCQTASTGPTGCTSNGSTTCPKGYTCSSGTCTTTQKICVRTQGTCSPSCSSDQYCDASDSTCKPKWGCEVNCTSCPSSAKISNVFSGMTTVSGGLNDFVTAGGTLLGTDSTAPTAEQAQHWLTTTGLGSTTVGSASGAVFCASAGSGSGAISGFTSAAPNTQYPGSNVFIQIGDYLYRALGGNSPVYTVLASFANSFVNGIAYSASGAWGFPAMVGPPGSCTATTTSKGTCTVCTVSAVSCAIDPTQCTTTYTQCGHVVYEGANNFGTSSNSAPLVKTAGQHVILDSLIDGSAGAGGPTPSTTELARSTPVTQPITGQFAVGTFDWKYEKPAAGSVFTQWSPSSNTYPWTTGHFRLYTPATTDSNAAFGTAAWDLADWINGSKNGGSPPSRTILFPYKSGTTYTLTPFTVANAGKVAQTMFGVTSPTATQTTLATNVINKVLANHSLGGIDYGTPAIIQQSQGLVSGNATLRPTVAYVGARDGMLHAVCVAAKGGTIAAPGQCYGQDPGSELWAVIPPAVLSAMATAYSSNDWSQINVGGAIRVADVFDFLTPGTTTQKAWKTLLIFGTRATGAVGAMDISDPDPNNYTASNDFRFLWELNGSNTTPAMGMTLGATIATPSTTGVAIVTSATKNASSGVNVYMVRLYDGTILDHATKTYTKSLPGIVSAGTLPNVVPPLATVLDSDSDGTDDSVFVPDAQGDVLKIGLSTSTFSTATPLTTLFDASVYAGCGSSSACQPFGASVSVAKRLAATPGFVLLAASGGVDWASTSSGTTYKLYGVDPTTAATTPMFARTLGTMSVTGFGGTGTQTLPVRSYAQPMVIGTDSWVDGTTLSLGDTNQLLMPVLWGGAWGEAVSYGLGTAPSDLTVASTASVIKPTGAYGGGFGSALVTGNALVEIGTSGLAQHVLTSTQLTTSAAMDNMKIVTPQTRTYKVTSWFEIGE